MNKAILILIASFLLQPVFCQNLKLKYDENGQLYTGKVENPKTDEWGTSNDIEFYDNGQITKYIEIQHNDTTLIKEYDNGKEVYSIHFYTRTKINSEKYGVNQKATRIVTIKDKTKDGYETITKIKDGVIQTVTEKKYSQETNKFETQTVKEYNKGRIEYIWYHNDGEKNMRFKGFFRDHNVDGYYYVREVLGYDRTEVTTYQTGDWKFYYKSGKLKAEGSYNAKPDHRNDKTGNWIHYYENETVKSKGKMNDGHNSGLWQYFYESGKLKEEGTYIDGYLSNIWTEYYKTGEIKSKYTIILEDDAKDKDDIGTSTFVKYFKNGQISEEGEFVIHDYDHYDRDEPISLSNVRYHNKIIHYYENGNIKETGIYYKGKKDGKFKYYDQKGKLIKSEKFKY